MTALCAGQLHFCQQLLDPWMEELCGASNAVRRIAPGDET